ncbi:FACT complex subunit SPT16 [Gautieria morchelliformis]|nr:FACT complex subunit SPT16 [Gautieria morchelliformis]
MHVELNTKLFSERVKLVYDAWASAGHKEEYESLAGIDALLLVAGDPAGEDEPVRKTTAFQTWLLGYEFPSTLILFTKQKIYFLCSASKAKVLIQIEQSNQHIPVQIFAQAKPKDPPSDAFPAFVALYKSHEKVGMITKEKHSGKVVDEWNKLIKDEDVKVEVVDMSYAVSAFMAVKDEEELKWMRTAANLSSTLLTHHVAAKLEQILDKETKITHQSFADQIESRIGSGDGERAPDARVWSKGRALGDVDWSSVEFVYTPVIQSRSSRDGYDLRASAEASSDHLSHKGIVLVSLGMRYKSYCSNVGRTFMVDPTKEQEANYDILLALQAELLTVMRDGATARDVYTHALSYIKEKKPELERYFLKSIGFGMGMEFRDTAYLLSPKNSRPLRIGMVFCLSLGLQGLEEKDGKKYALSLIDTVKITPDKGVCLTEGIKSPKEFLFFFDDEPKAKKSSPAKPKKALPAATKNGKPSPAQKVVGNKVLRGKTRGAASEDALEVQAKLAQHQKALHQQRHQDGLARWAEEEGDVNGKEGKAWKKFQSYKGDGALPHEVEDLRVRSYHLCLVGRRADNHSHAKIHVDRKNLTVILPIHGFAAAFHINSIKNASKSDEGEFTFLRINFQTPGQLAGKKEDTPFENPDATFIRSVTYRSPDGNRFDYIFKQITELKKEVNKREQQKKAMADVIEQDSLIEVKGRRPVKLPEVFVRPALDGKRLPGEVELHQNGLRYVSPLGSQRIDILFSNIKHFFFQPCDHELLVILHVHLKAPIMIGKKKAHDVQFYREASDVQFDETGNRKRKYRYGDEDEIELEQSERKRRHALNKEFNAFAERCMDSYSSSMGETMEVEVPFRELSFEGVPHRTNVRLQPTTECLVHLSDPPFLVVTLSEIEIVSLERVQFGLRQFDMVMIFKDFRKTPLSINSIPSGQLDDVKHWLDSSDIPMSEGPVNLNWGPIMKTINDDPYDFFLQGGWSFLGGADGSDAEVSSSSSESDFVAEPDALDDPSSSNDDGSDFDGDDASEDEGSDSDEDFGGGDDSEDRALGDDWDELERKAAKSDKKRETNGKSAADSDSGSDRPKKKQPSKTNGKSVPKAKGKR